MTKWLDADGDPLPEKMLLKPSRLKWFIVFLIGLGFVAIGIFLGDDMESWKRWLIVAFFALCSFVAIPQMIGVGSQLELNAKGFIVKTLGRTWQRQWRGCSPFEVITLPRGGRRVGFSAVQDESHMLAGVARSMVGTTGMLPDNYGVDPAALADLMNRFRDRALGS